jgi:hypothetical protein
MSLLDAVKYTLRMCGHAFSITVHERLDVLEQRQAETDHALLQANIRLAERVRESARYTVVECAEATLQPPLKVLLEFLIAQGASPKNLHTEALTSELRPLVQSMATRGLPWFLVIYGDSFYANLPYPLPEGAGDIVFFRDYDTFLDALDWCTAILRRTYFRPIE